MTEVKLEDCSDDAEFRLSTQRGTRKSRAERKRDRYLPRSSMAKKLIVVILQETNFGRKQFGIDAMDDSQMAAFGMFTYEERGMKRSWDGNFTNCVRIAFGTRPFRPSILPSKTISK